MGHRAGQVGRAVAAGAVGGVLRRAGGEHGGLAYAMRDLPVGTSYAVWVGIGATLTVVYAMATGTEPVSLVKVLLLAGIVGCVVGLKVIE